MSERKGKVLVVGAGGLGCPALLSLAVGNVALVGIADGDAVELSNLHRQILHGAADLGRNKAQSVAEKLAQLDDAPRIRVLPEAIDAGNAAGVLVDYDFVIDATDGAGSKFLLNDAALAVGKPLAHAGVIGFEGQCLTVLPGDTACLRCLFPVAPAEDDVAACRGAGIFGPLAGLVGALQANEAIRWLRGDRPRFADRLLTIDLRDARFRQIPLRRSHDCPLCANRPPESRLTGSERRIS